MFERLEPTETGHLQIEQHQIGEAVLKPLQQRFTGFIPHQVMALPRQPFHDGAANRLFIVGHKDDGAHQLAFHQLEILG